MIYDAGRQHETLDEWLESEPVEIERPTVAELVDILEHSRRRNSLGTVLSLLGHADRSHPVNRVYRKMAGCGKGATGWTTQGWKWIRYSCGWVGCPRCHGRLKAKEARKVYSAIEQKLGRAPDVEEASYLTINIGYAALGSDLSEDREDFRKAIRKTLRQLPYDVSAHLEFELAPQPDRMGLFHVHGWMLHPQGVRDDIKKKLKSSFPEYKVVHLQPPHSNFVKEEIIDSAEYQADVDLTMKGFGIDTPQVLADLIQSIESIRSRGRQGLRFKYNMRPVPLTDADLIEDVETSA